MKMSVSNIAWDISDDCNMYTFFKENDIEGLEIAPTRIIPDNPYDKKDIIMAFSNEINKNYGLQISSMQSIWYGKNELLFGSNEEYLELLEYTKKAINFAESANCGNIVFGCPKNRVIKSNDDIKKAVCFFNEIGDYAINHNTIFSLEANPIIYGTNFLNTTESVLLILKELGTKGVKLNLDLGTMIYNNEKIDIIVDFVEQINHIHISEPYLNIIEKRDIHQELADLLKSKKYSKFISIEMKNPNNIDLTKEKILYIMEVFK